MEYNNIDPDYKANNTAIRRAELNQSEDEKVCEEDLCRIIKDKFDNELAKRTKHIENIEENLFKAQKLLHLVRYALVTQYYNSKSLQADSDEFEDINPLNLDKQYRIHPAVKKLLGQNSTIQLLNRGKRKAKHIIENKSTTTQASTEESMTKKAKLDSLDPVLLPKVSSSVSSSRNRKKVTQRIILGNISKYMPSKELDNLTHKWMVYVRGPTESPDVSSFIQKVVFYLHPSYKPYDVVEVLESPFHLARRGWGEFPIRVQIFFKNDLNKPVDLVHNLKLDQKHTGRQCLGNETLVDLFLHEKVSDLDNPVNNELQNEELQELQSEELLDDLHIEPKLEFDSFNHDGDFVESFHSEYSDHDYSLSEGSVKKLENNILNNNPDTPLIHGLDDSFFNDNTKTENSKKESPKTIKSPIKSPTVKMITNSAGKNIYFITNSNGPLLNKNLFILKPKNPQTILKPEDISKVLTSVAHNFEPKIDYNQFKIELPENTFKNMGEVLPYLFKKLPLWSNLANNLNYKCTYPFTAPSFKDYSSYNVGKQLSAEWSRAKTIKKILRQCNFPYIEEWNTKTILMYGRSHGFTAQTTYSIFKNDCSEKNLIINCFENSTSIHKNKNKNHDVNVDILTLKQDAIKPNETMDPIDVSDPKLKPHCSFVRQTALNSGIILKSEEIQPNVIFNGAERMLLEAVKSLADSLIRRSMSHLVSEGNYVEGKSEITKEHVELALNERKEIKDIRNFEKMKRELEFFM
ncbi:unnamed protein product [Brassicogethes aeneus]|uniref:YEATS domain-containing protein n=1 Tax=Brassicogethes aeneus TaxID=1431903 RepID=A0A9P0B7T2_BRAAE|nr:unnamed protein product [Brassicogethes aeneus]